MTATTDPAVRHVAALRQRIQDLSRELYLERERRHQAERNAKQFHAMLIAERVQNLSKRAA